MTTRFRFLPAALDDLEAAAAWHAAQQPGLGDELLDEFDACIGAALDMPGAGALAGTTSGGNEIRRFDFIATPFWWQ